MKIQRFYNISDFLAENKVTVIYGPRQVGKTTLVRDFLEKYSEKYRFDTGDDIRVREILGSESLEVLRQYAQGYNLLVIDEAQRIPKIGIGLKILVDHCPGLKVIVTGSSSFALSGQIGEPLTGRKFELHLFPIAQIELRKMFSSFDLSGQLEEMLIYGAYPAIFDHELNLEARRQFLMDLTGSYLLKDILELENIKNSKALLDLLRLLAFQVGNEVSLNELAVQLGIDSKTVARYIDLFEKSFVIYSLRGYSRNLRKEIRKKQKYYFYDNGVRNAVISNFNPITLRDDIGALWENFIVMERLKKRTYQQIWANNYFWRTWDRQEVDFLEERDGKIFGFEMKYKKQQLTPPSQWMQNYPEAEFQIIHQKNYLDFIA